VKRASSARERSEPPPAPGSPAGDLPKEDQGSLGACLPAKGAGPRASLGGQFTPQSGREQQPAEGVAQFSETSGIDEQGRIARDFGQR